MDDLEQNIVNNPLVGVDWLGCIIKSKGDKNQCLKFAAHLVAPEATVMAVLVLLSLNGLWSLFFLGRVSMFVGWYDMVRGRVKPNNEFVSADASAFKDPRSYEMLSRDRETTKTPEPLVSYPLTPLSPAANPKSGRETPDYFGREARYQTPSQSFSKPNAPHTRQNWDEENISPRPHVYPGMDPLSMNKI